LLGASRSANVSGVKSSDKVHKFYTKDLAVRASFVTATQLCSEIADLQDTDPLATIALGRLVIGTILLASQLWENQSLSVRMEGNGPLGYLYAEASFEGKVRAYISNPRIEPHSPVLKTLDFKEAIGEGVLTVTKNLPFQKQPQTGIVPIVSGEIAQDLAFYLHQSQQTLSVISLSVNLNSEGHVSSAAGFLLELIPGASEQVIQELENRTRKAPALSELLNQGLSPLEIMEHQVHGSPLVAIEHPYAIALHCRCSQDRVEKTLSLMGRATLAEMVLKGEEVKVRCEFCGKSYVVTLSTLRGLLTALED